MRATLEAIVVSVLMAAVVPAGAAAETYVLERDRDTVVCRPVPFEDCDAVTCGRECGPIGPSGGNGCHSRALTALCCDDSVDCVVGPAGTPHVGTCRPIRGLTTDGGSSVMGVCEFFDPMWCGATDVLDLYPCVPASGYDFGAGNCDLDGMSNRDDADDWCNSEPAPDGGVRPRDAGRTTSDPPPSVNFRGGGGCVCRASGARVSSRGAWLFALVGIAIAVVRRSRSRD